MDKDARTAYAALNEIIEFETECINHTYLPERTRAGDLIWRCLYGGSNCLKSCMFLLEGNFIGSLNALLRQVYEFLVWAKATLDATEEQRERLGKEFFQSPACEGLSEHANISKLFKSLVYEGFPQCNGTAIMEEGKELYKLYSEFTHASAIAQIQYDAENKVDSDKMKKWSFKQVAFLTDIYLFVLDQYIDEIKIQIKPLLGTEVSGRDNIAACLMCKAAMDFQNEIEEKHNQICFLTDDEIERNPIWYSFIDEWHIKEKNTNEKT